MSNVYNVISHIGQIIDEDEDFLTLKVGKWSQAVYDTDDGDTFVRLAFLAKDEQGRQVLPWYTDPIG